jgi:hypothetical protein
MSELGQNAWTGLNKTGESANATMSEHGKNVTDAGKTLLNKTGEVLQGVGSGAASVLGNITGEIKEGISGVGSNYAISTNFFSLPVYS